ncbi:hypothetical protein F511_43846 [Dorcoceras hygrometricum]|uniref:Uncharacterized protein n=1 Tax=Dorcoceras hygrometricum TaxID=472368 RepID=A0A2Z7AIR4_9LAMI|nr:hypothetical protein F511_43846 [Dorcoceras hygrometricum]
MAVQVARPVGADARTGCARVDETCALVVHRGWKVGRRSAQVVALLDARRWASVNRCCPRAGRARGGAWSHAGRMDAACWPDVGRCWSREEVGCWTLCASLLARQRAALRRAQHGGGGRRRAAAVRRVSGDVVTADFF